MSENGARKAGVRKLRKRRSRVVPIVTGGCRRKWRRASSESHWATLHLFYLQHRERYLAKYFGKHKQYPYPRNWLVRAWRWYVGDVFFQSLDLVRRNGEFVREAAGVPIWKQRLDILLLSFSVPSMPENYYKFEWYRSENKARASEYLHRYETKGVLFTMLTDVKSIDTVSPLTNKTEFVKRAEDASLSTTPILGIFDGKSGEVVEELPAQDLFVKPETGRGGSGAHVWEYDKAVDRFKLVGGSTVVSRAGLVDELAKASRRRRLIVQPRLINHPDIADLALDAVPTCRMVTITNEDGEGEPVIAVFRMPAVPERVVDNIHAGGIAAPVDLSTGRLGKATDLGLSPSGRHSTHPQSGAQIEGRVVPHWDDVLKLATEAHRCFAPRVIAGWDISIGPAGPVLVEGNAQPCVDLLQRPHDLPLGSHRFGELMAFHLRRRFDRSGAPDVSR